MIVAMVTVRVMKTTVDKIVDVVTMRNGLVTAAGSMHMILVVTTAIVLTSARVRIHVRYFQSVLNDGSIFRDMLQLAVLQIANVIPVLNRRVPAVRAVIVFLI